MAYKIYPVTKKEDIPGEYRGSPISLLLEYHNLKRKFEACPRAQLLIGMCIDNRECINIPDNFAYIVRFAGVNIQYSEFNVSYAIAIGGVKHIALIAHSDCGMVDLKSKKEEFINGLVGRAGWKKKPAEEHFMRLYQLHEICNEIGFIMAEADRLSAKYPKIKIAPLYYRVEDRKLCFIRQG
jgi:carbonic anhydrase